MFIRIILFAFAASALGNLGYAEMPTPVGTPSAAPSPSATAAPPQSNASPSNPVRQDQDTVTRLQIYLDEHSFRPGKIDGRWGEFIGKALQHFQAANGQPASGQIDAAFQQELGKISPVYTTYTLTDEDLHWVGNIPSRPAGMAKLKKILYRSALDYVAERYSGDAEFVGN